MSGAPAPPPSTPGPAPAFCPNCRAPVVPGTRFCGQCGAALPVSGGPAVGPSSPAPASASGGPAPPVDIRQRVEEDRGALKRLQLLIPGFRGYRLGEDLRDADSFLRRAVADKLVDALGQLTQARRAMSQANQFSSMTTLAQLISDLTTLEGRVRHAEMGYSGISAPIRVTPETLDRLYEYDYGFVLAADQFRAAEPPLLSAIQQADSAGIQREVGNLRGLLGQLTNAFQARMTTVEGIRV